MRERVTKSLIVASLLFFGITCSFATEFNFSGNAEGSPSFSESATGYGTVFGQSANGNSYGSYNSFDSYGSLPSGGNGIPGMMDGPVLYDGPGGDPIGGLPIGEGVYILFFGVLLYCMYKVGCKVYYVRMSNRKRF